MDPENTRSVIIAFVAWAQKTGYIAPFNEPAALAQDFLDQDEDTQDTLHEWAAENAADEEA